MDKDVEMFRDLLFRNYLENLREELKQVLNTSMDLSIEEMLQKAYFAAFESAILFCSSEILEIAKSETPSFVVKNLIAKAKERTHGNY